MKSEAGSAGATLARWGDVPRETLPPASPEDPLPEDWPGQSASEKLILNYIDIL